MALLEAAFFTISIGFFMLVVYVLPLLSGKFLCRATFLLGKWLGGGINKEKSLERLTTPVEKWPRSWWTDEKHFELEQEVIFRKKWLFVAHFSEFEKPGDYRTFKIAGFPVLIILGKDKQLRAFHNVCRHRAYVVTKKEKGSSTVLGCKYHGWSYDTKGKLIKAPEFEKVPGFDKGINGLWELGIEVNEGLVFINIGRDCLSREMNVTISKDLRKWKLGEMKCIARWTVEPLKEGKEGKGFNWKLLGSTEMRDSRVKGFHLFRTLFSQFNAPNESVFLSPGTRIRRIDNRTVLMMNAIPITPEKTTLNCIILSQKRRSGANLDEWKTRVDKYLELLSLRYLDTVACRRQETNDQPISNTVEEITDLLSPYINGEMSSHAASEMTGSGRCLTQKGRLDDDFCRQLENETGGQSACTVNAKGLLDW